jgi:hypothetical protein
MAGEGDLGSDQEKVNFEKKSFLCKSLILPSDYEARHKIIQKIFPNPLTRGPDLL